MFFYKDEEVARNLVDLEVANRDYVLSLIPAIKSAIKSFGGKVINKRFVNALDNSILKCDNYVRGTYLDYELNSFSFVLKVFVPNVSVRDGSCGCSYVTHRWIEICRISPDKAVCYTESGNARLNADSVIKGVDEGVTMITNYIQEQKSALENVAEWKAELEKVDSILNSLCDTIPCDIAQYFGLRYYLSKSY